jgi:hypothetical protein
MRRARLLPFASVLAASASSVLLHACGARTPLLDGAPEATGSDASDSAVSVHEAAAPIDATEEPLRDAANTFDRLPPIDAAPRDANLTGCPDASVTLIYVLTEEQDLFSFDPPTATFSRIGHITCPGTQSSPWSMAVDREGIAYSVFLDGQLFRISTSTAACQATTYVPDQSGFHTFGMGYVADPVTGDETLFVDEARFMSAFSLGLARIDTSTYTLHVIGGFQPQIPRAELTGTSDGRLFAFYLNTDTSGSHVAEIDKTSGRIVVPPYALRVGDPMDAWAFAYWGGDFWIFTGTQMLSTVTRFRPSDGSEATITTLPASIVGAGVSTCAPSG